MNLNDITFVVSVFFLPIWLIWELVVLIYLRPRGATVDSHLVGTISMIMQQRAYQINVIPFFWAGMAAHWWVNWLRTPVWSNAVPTVLYWVIVAGVLGLDVILWSTAYQQLPEWAKVLRSPMVQVVLGFFTAYFLFPQAALKGGFRWW
jgi:hypothetical protein